MSARIAEILSENSFTFGVTTYISIHKRLFTGLYSHAGQIRDYDISKSEWVLNGESVMYGGASELRATLEYDIQTESQYANMMYVMRKQMTPDQIAEIFRKLSLIFEFADFSPAVLERAVTMKWKDFEDAVQSATAESVHADYIITRNLKDFTQSRVMAFTPSELLARI